MSLHPQPDCVIPNETRRVAHAAFPNNGNLCIRIADVLGALSRDDQFADLSPPHGQPALALARLALASVLQYVEGHSGVPPDRARSRERMFHQGVSRVYDHAKVAAKRVAPK